MFVLPAFAARSPGYLLRDTLKNSMKVCHLLVIFFLIFVNKCTVQHTYQCLGGIG